MGGWGGGGCVSLGSFPKKGEGGERGGGSGGGRGEVATLGHFARVMGLYHMIKLFNQGDKNMNDPICPI